jgi:hypothetical protein
MSHVHFFKMEEKRLTADRYPLHFEVLGLYPIPVGEMQRWASDSEARLFKSLRFPPKAFVFPALHQFMIVLGRLAGC